MQARWPTIVFGYSIELPAIDEDGTAMGMLARYTDLLLFSSYPYKQAIYPECTANCGGTEVIPFASNYYDRAAEYAAGLGLRWGVHEGGMINKELNITTYGLYANGSPENQLYSVLTLLDTASEFDALMVVNWATINFQPLTDWFLAVACGGVGYNCTTYLESSIWESTGLADHLVGATDVAQLNARAFPPSPSGIPSWPRPSARLRSVPLESWLTPAASATAASRA